MDRMPVLTVSQRLIRSERARLTRNGRPMTVVRIAIPAATPAQKIRDRRAPAAGRRWWSAPAGPPLPIRPGRGPGPPPPGDRAGTSRPWRAGRAGRSARHRSRARGGARAHGGGRRSSSCACRCSWSWPCSGAGGVRRSVIAAQATGQAQHAEQDEHHRHRQLHGQAERRRDDDPERDDRDADHQHGDACGPRPHRAPIRVECAKRRVRDRMVVTAITWSASVACRIPSTNPNPANASSSLMASSATVGRWRLYRCPLRILTRHGSRRITTHLPEPARGRSRHRSTADIAILGVPHGVPLSDGGSSAACADAPAAIRQRSARLASFVGTTTSTPGLGDARRDPSGSWTAATSRATRPMGRQCRASRGGRAHAARAGRDPGHPRRRRLDPDPGPRRLRGPRPAGRAPGRRPSRLP